MGRVVSSYNYPFYPVYTNQFSGLVVALLTTRLQIQLINAPVVQVLFEGYRTPLLSQVKFPRPVEVDDGPEVPGMSVKVVLIVLRVELVAQLQDLLGAPSPPQFAQSCLRQSVYEGPGDIEPEYFNISTFTIQQNWTDIKGWWSVLFDL